MGHLSFRLLPTPSHEGAPMTLPPSGKTPARRVAHCFKGFPVQFQKTPKYKKKLLECQNADRCRRTSTAFPHQRYQWHRWRLQQPMSTSDTSQPWHWLSSQVSIQDLLSTMTPVEAYQWRHETQKISISEGWHLDTTRCQQHNNHPENNWLLHLIKSFFVEAQKPSLVLRPFDYFENFLPAHPSPTATSGAKKGDPRL